MLDVICSASLLGGLILWAFAWLAYCAFAGGAAYQRVDADGGSVLFGKRLMNGGYWVLQPVARACEHLGIVPDAITMWSLLFGVAAGASFALGHFGVGTFLAVVSAFGDTLDGMVARATGVASDAGEVLDAAVDRYQEFAVLAGLAIWYRDETWMLVLSLGALLGSFMTSYASAKADAMRVTIPRGVMRRTERAVYVLLGAGLVPLVGFELPRAHVSQLPIVLALVAVAVGANVSAARRLLALAAQLRTQVRAPRAPHADWAAAFGRHQVASIAATSADFVTMIAAVRVAGAHAVAGTFVGATVGAFTNFAIGRTWTFGASAERVPAQAARYAMVSAGSLALNCAGEYLLVERVGLPYVFARACVAIAVAMLWNFPMQRQFVFLIESAGTT